MTCKLSKSKIYLIIVLFLSIYINSFGYIENKATSLTQATNSNFSIESNVTSGCVPLMVYFNSTDSCDICDHSWIFEEGHTSKLSQPSHLYNTPGIYFPSLSLIDSEGILHEIEIKIIVYPTPIAKFKVTPKEAYLSNPKVQFINESNISDNSALMWEWDFGDNSFSYNYEPSHSYLEIGNYDIRLKVSSSFGCSSQNTTKVKIREHFQAHFPTAFSPGSYLGNNFFYPKGKGAIRDYFLMEIYNSWGEQIYKTEVFPEGFFEFETIEGGWDGRSKNTGAFVKNGTYYYRVRIIDANKDKHMYEGTVTVIR